MFSPNCVVVLPASEIFLKSSAVRAFMLKKLQKNMLLCLKHFSTEHGNFVSLAGRIIIPSKEPVKVVSSLTKCFGIFALSVAEEVEYSSLDVLCNSVVEISRGVLKEGSFAVRGKSFVKGVSSKQLEEALGHHLLNQAKLNEVLQVQQNQGFCSDKLKNLKVKLKNPEQEVYCILHKDKAFIYFNSVSGALGMPLGSQGKVGLLATKSTKELELGELGKNLMKCGCSVVLVSDDWKVSLKELEEFNCFRPIKFFSFFEAKNLYSSRELVAFFSVAKTLVRAKEDSSLTGAKVFAPFLFG